MQSTNPLLRDDIIPPAPPRPARGYYLYEGGWERVTGRKYKVITVTDPKLIHGPCATEAEILRAQKRFAENGRQLQIVEMR